MKKKLCALLAGLVLLPAAGCARPARQELSDTAGPAEIPMEILGGLDDKTLENLVEEPQYAAITFDDGP